MEISEYESEGVDSESWGESESEAADRKRWAPPARASGAGLYKPRPPATTAPVSQVQLASAMSRVGDQLKKNSAAVTTVNSRVNAVNSSEKKDNEERKKDSKGINEKIQMLALLPALIQPTSTSVAPGTLTDTNGNDITKVVTPDTNSLNLALPLLLISGFGGSSGMGSGSDGGMDSSMMLLLVLALTGGLGPKS